MEYASYKILLLYFTFQVGTTVSLQNLFSSLPVRQKEFHRNLRREFSKMTQLLYAYCLVCTGTKYDIYSSNTTFPRTADFYCSLNF